MSKLTEIRSGGNPLEAIRTSEYLCSAVTSLNQLENYGLVRPTTNASARAKELKNDDQLAQAHNLRETVQRRFDKSRRERAKSYSAYLDQIMLSERLGGVPPITLYCSSKCEYDNESKTLFLPYRVTLINVDGETQTEARFMLRDRTPVSGDWSLSAQIYHGITEAHASQILHDFNRYAHPIREGVVAALNKEGHITRLIEEVMGENDILPVRLNRFGPKPNLKKGEIAAYRCLISAVVGAVAGLSGLDDVSKEIGLLNNGEGAAMVGAAKPFLVHLTELLKRDNSVGTTAMPVYGICGGIHHDFGKLVTLGEWHEAASAYLNCRTGKKGKTAMLEKRDAVLKALGLK